MTCPVTSFFYSQNLSALTVNVRMELQWQAQCHHNGFFVPFSS